MLMPSIFRTNSLIDDLFDDDWFDDGSGNENWWKIF